MQPKVEEEKPKRAVVCGAGYIGLEIAENLLKDGLDVTVIDMAPQIMPNAFDAEMAGWVRRKMEGSGIRVLTSARLESIEGEGKAERVRTDRGEIPADIVILALGVRPCTAFLKDSGIESAIFGESSAYPALNAVEDNIELKVNAADYDLAVKILDASSSAE